MAVETKRDNLGNSILIGRCKCDSMLKFPFHWCKEVITEAENKGFKVIDLKKEDFTEEQVNKHMDKFKPSLVFLNGHGDTFCAKGYQKEPVISMNKNDYLLKDKIVHVISCKTAVFLGQYSKDKGCKGYLGYTGEFSIKKIYPEPEEDEISNMFKEPVNTASITLINGGTVKEAYINSQKVYKKNIAECKKSYFDRSLPDTMRDFIQGVISDLESNQRLQVFF